MTLSNNYFSLKRHKGYHVVEASIVVPICILFFIITIDFLIYLGLVHRIQVFTHELAMTSLASTGSLYQVDFDTIEKKLGCGIQVIQFDAQTDGLLGTQLRVSYKFKVHTPMANIVSLFNNQYGYVQGQQIVKISNFYSSQIRMRIFVDQIQRIQNLSEVIALFTLLKERFYTLLNGMFND